jgi:uncharacterized protein
VIDTHTVQRFLASDRIAVVGASDDKSNFGNTIYRALREHGYRVYAVNPNAATVAGDPCVPALDDVPEAVDGVMVVVSGERALDVVDACVRLGIAQVWLFKGLGGPGAMSDEAVERCTANGIDVVAGACPLMFLEPVGWFHKVHRAARRLNGSLTAAA